MSTMIEHDDERTKTVEDELHELEGQEQELERRTQSLEVTGPLTLIFSVLALALAIGAMIVAVSNKGSSPDRVASGEGVPASLAMSGAHNSGGMPMSSHTSGGSMMSSSSSSHMGMMGVGGHGSFTSSEVAAAARGTIHVQLGDYWAAPAVSSVRTGKVTFIARNVGQVPHELMVERMPIKLDSPMHPTESAAQGMIADMSSGQSGHMTLQLAPGTYMLFCNAPGHYELGQHTIFRVTKS